MRHDKRLLQRRFSRSLTTYDTLATVQRGIADRLGGLLGSFAAGGDVTRGLEIGGGTGFLTRHLVRLFPEAEWTVNDLVPNSRRYLPDTVDFVAGDGEAFPLAEGHYDLIASASTVQWFDDLPGFLGRAAAGLRPCGVLGLSTFGPGNFREISVTTGQGLEYLPLDELCERLRAAGLEILHADEWPEQQRYPAPVDVLRHLRLTGVNAVAAERWTHSRLRQFEADYRAAFTLSPSPDGDGAGEVSLTFRPIIVIAQKP